MSEQLKIDSLGVLIRLGSLDAENHQLRQQLAAKDAEIADAWREFKALSERCGKSVRDKETDLAAAQALLVKYWDALEAAVECGMIPVTSAKEGGAAKHSRQVHVADMIRAALAIQSDKAALIEFGLKVAIAAADETYYNTITTDERLNEIVNGIIGAKNA